MAKRRPQKHLLFIDTNIYLDFYRQSKDAATESLELIEKHIDKVICTFQVEMEFKKNRQKVIFDSFKLLKNPDWGSLTPPSILADSEPANIIEKKKTIISKQQSNLKKRLTDIVSSPTTCDDVYQVLQKLFKNDSALNLRDIDANQEKITEILGKSKARFFRGVPPRKNSDTSYGDAINWEWMVRCAELQKSNLIVVTRDQDYGLKFNDLIVANDWLQTEFKNRVNIQKKLIVTDRLAEAFRILKISVSHKAEIEEKRFVDEIQQTAPSHENSQTIHQSSVGT